MTRKIVTLNESMVTMIKDLNDHNGHMSDSETIRHCIAFTYSKTFGRERPTFRTSKKAFEEVSDDYCARLKGEVISKNGERLCKYTTTTAMAGGEVEETEVVVPFAHLTEDHIINQHK